MLRFNPFIHHIGSLFIGIKIMKNTISFLEWFNGCDTN